MPWVQYLPCKESYCILQKTHLGVEKEEKCMFFTRETRFFPPESIQNLLELATHLALTHQVRRDYWKELAGVPMNNNQTRGWQKEADFLSCISWDATTAAVAEPEQQPQQLWEPVQPREAGGSSSWQGLVEPGQQQPLAFGSLLCTEIHREHQAHEGSWEDWELNLWDS